MAEEEVLTLREVAALLRVGEKTAYGMAQSGVLPGFKVGNQWRFRRNDIDRWMNGRVKKGRWEPDPSADADGQGKTGAE